MITPRLQEMLAQMKSIRIGSGAGYSGDRIEPAIDLIKHGDLDYIIFECLAERTISIAQQNKLRDAKCGYDSLLDERMRRALPALRDRRVRLISNMGAANPLGAAERIYEMASEIGLSGLRIAAVTGDDVSSRLNEYLDFDTFETDAPLRDLSGQVISANAYTGGRKITEALKEGAQIIITGRTADPALAVGPLMHEFAKSYDDYDFLGKATVAGHLLECGSQVMGGYFADPGYKEVPDLWNVGFPIANFDEAGTVRIEKLPGAGGTVNTATVKEQLLYEIHDPAKYLTPDVVADFSNVSVFDNGNDSVTVQGASGREKTGQLKVSVGYLDGYIGEGEISYGGPGALPRARLAAEVIRRRFELVGLELRDVRFDFIGVNSLYGEAGRWPANQIAKMQDYRDVRLRVAGRTASEMEADVIGREVEALYTNGPAGGGGARHYTRKIVSIASILIPETDVTEQIRYFDL
jgi:Acyclic terpene utilisation family protein AtuA